MKVKFTREQRIVNALMIHASLIDNLGLLHGKMGVALCFFHLGRLKGNEVFTRFAEGLLDEVIEGLHTDLPVDFENGITGIGWAAEHLIQNGFVEADADDILEELDAKVKRALMHEECGLDTIISIGYYLVSRISYRADNDDSMVVLDMKYLIILLTDEIERQIAGGASSSVLYDLLSELHKLNVFNHKVEKLLTLCQRGFAACHSECSVAESKNLGDPSTSLRMTGKNHKGDFAISTAVVERDSCSYLIPYIPRLSAPDVEAIMNGKDVRSRYAGFDMKLIPESERWGLKRGIAGFGLQKIFIDNGL